MMVDGDVLVLCTGDVLLFSVTDKKVRATLVRFWGAYRVSLGARSDPGGRLAQRLGSLSPKKDYSSTVETFSTKPIVELFHILIISLLIIS